MAPRPGTAPVPPGVRALAPPAVLAVVLAAVAVACGDGPEPAPAPPAAAVARVVDRAVLAGPPRLPAGTTGEGACDRVLETGPLFRCRRRYVSPGRVVVTLATYTVSVGRDGCVRGTLRGGWPALGGGRLRPTARRIRRCDAALALPGPAAQAASRAGAASTGGTGRRADDAGGTTPASSSARPTSASTSEVANAAT